MGRACISRFVLPVATLEVEASIVGAVEVTLTVWVADDAKLPRSATQSPRAAPVTVSWGKFRGPGTVTFANNKPAVEKVASKVTPDPAFSGKATTTATFSEPGEYVLRVVANDASGDGGRGFQCCWTNAQVKVSVKRGAAAGGR